MFHDELRKTFKSSLQFSESWLQIVAVFLIVMSLNLYKFQVLTHVVKDQIYFA
ncbi:hypothetical protein ACHHYP_20818 [Achlya hypogyna]|uniref:Uncharacterized protein n=1 Tax=Achlya hypogyna TaxID=1202772 RepID=A0A1V9Y777_ACHHY|nr:hypothetical protein ACHHYP_20818 [Achlya hypogyna]